MMLLNVASPVPVGKASVRSDCMAQQHVDDPRFRSSILDIGMQLQEQRRQR